MDANGNGSINERYSKPCKLITLVFAGKSHRINNEYTLSFRLYCYENYSCAFFPRVNLFEHFFPFGDYKRYIGTANGRSHYIVTYTEFRTDIVQVIVFSNSQCHTSESINICRLIFKRSQNPEHNMQKHTLKK